MRRHVRPVSAILNRHGRGVGGRAYRLDRCENLGHGSKVEDEIHHRGWVERWLNWCLRYGFASPANSAAAAMSTLGLAVHLSRLLYSAVDLPARSIRLEREAERT